MNKIKEVIINYALKKPWALFDGKKAYVAGAGLILMGAGQIAAQIAAAPDPMSLAAVLQGIQNGKSWEMIMIGLGYLGVRHAQAKASEAKESDPKPAHS